MKIPVSLFLGLVFIAPSLAANIVSLNINKELNKDYSSLSKRMESEQLSFRGNSYYVRARVGTPPQEVRLEISTEDIRTWVMGNSSHNQCVEQSTCLDDAIFIPESSTTYHESEGHGFHVIYSGGGPFVEGAVFKDVFAIGNLETTTLKLGLAQNSSGFSVQTGSLGLDYDKTISGISQGLSFLDNLVAKKIINSPIYSLSLGHSESHDGAILFGGIDTAKFQGELLTTPILPRSNASTHRNIDVSLSSVGFNGNYDGHNLTLIAAHLVSAYPWITLPRKAIDPIIERYGGAQWDDEYKKHYVNCSLPTEHPDDYLEFQFAADTSQDILGSTGPRVRIPISELILDESTEKPANALSRKYYFGFFPSEPVGDGDNIAHLGDVFLRSAYVVYDLKNNIIGMVQSHSSNSSNDHNIVEIGVNSTTIPRLCGGTGASCTSNIPSKSDKTLIGIWVLCGLTIVIVVVLLGLWLSSKAPQYRPIDTMDDTCVGEDLMMDDLSYLVDRE